MPNILHRLTIDAPPQRVQEQVATKEGVQRWWTGRAVTGSDELGGRIAVYFGDADNAAAVFEVLESDAQRVGWLCVEGPSDWLDTRITFVLNPRDDGGTTLLFSHEGWEKESEFMSGCSTNWASYLMSLKAGAESGAFAPFPAGEISRWG
jgi:uncharacterized protein YndB with AHSA1/START domain